jgi:hypothetical protein
MSFPVHEQTFKICVVHLVFGRSVEFIAYFQYASNVLHLHML